MTTHYMDEAEFCDRIAIMDQGQIVALDTPEALKAQVGADRVRIQHRRTTTRPSRRWRSASASRRRCSEGAVTFRVPSGERVRAAAVRRARASPSESVSVSRPTLDDVFMSHTGTTIRDAEESRSQARQPRDDADDERRPPMSATEQAFPASPRDRGRPVRVPARSWRSELRAVKIVWRRELHPLLQRPHRASSPRWSSRCSSCSCSAPACSSSPARATHGVDLKTFIYPGVLCHRGDVHGDVLGRPRSSGTASSGSCARCWSRPSGAAPSSSASASAARRWRASRV